MKQLLTALTMLAALGLPADTAAQTHRHTPRHAAVDKPQTADTSAIEAFSDTTGTGNDTASTAAVPAASPRTPSFQVDIDHDSLDEMNEGLNEMGKNIFGTVAILLILFVFSPVAIIGLICFFIYKLHKQKVELAETALKNGQPIPQDLRNDKPKTPEQYWQNGIKKVAIGLGLVALFAVGLDSWALSSIGFFVAIYGAGQLVISKTMAKKEKAGETPDSTDDLAESDFENS